MSARRTAAADQNSALYCTFVYDKDPEPTTEPPTTEEPTTSEPESTTEVETTVPEPTTEIETTVEPTTIEETTVEPTTTVPETTERSTEFPLPITGDDSWLKLWLACCGIITSAGLFVAAHIEKWRHKSN